jgi:response regulator RpfG family c-di-GMP phosphodiesterase
MKQELAIICIEDEPEVLESILRDLEIFEDYFKIEAAQSVNEARGLVQLMLAAGVAPALFICDHLMPGETGVDYLVQLSKDRATARASRMLLTGQAGLPDTVRAVNEGGLDFYLAKPWKTEDLQKIAKKLLTDFVVEHVTNVLPYLGILDGEAISNAMRNRKTLTDQ